MKAEAVEKLIHKVREQYRRAVEALEGAHEAATGEDTKAESKYDTRGLEASYLAAGQAEQADELSRALHALENFDFPDFDLDDPIANGALVELDQDGDSVFYLLAPAGGGNTIELDTGETITVLGPASPLRSQLLDKTTGSFLEDNGFMVLEVF